jgi:hypothetical protein
MKRVPQPSQAITEAALNHDVTFTRPFYSTALSDSNNHHPHVPPLTQTALAAVAIVAGALVVPRCCQLLRCNLSFAISFLTDNH